MSVVHLRRGEDLAGLTFGSLTVVRRLLRPGHHAVYLCACACGIETDARADNLRSGRTTSCGCRRTAALVERSTKREPALVVVPPPPPSDTRVRLPVVPGFVHGRGDRHETCTRYLDCLMAYRGSAQAQCPDGARDERLGCYRAPGTEERAEALRAATTQTFNAAGLCPSTYGLGSNDNRK